MDYLDGALESPVRREFDRHLQVCPNCRRYLAVYKTATLIGRRAFDEDDLQATEAGVPDELIEAILSARLRSS